MKKTLRSLAILGTVAALAFALVACNKPADPNPPVDPNANTAGDKTYVIYSDNAFAPFEFLDTASGAYIGVDMDILAAVAADQGFAYEVKNEGFDPAMAAVQAGQADGMIAGMTITEKRMETFDFSDGYFEDGQIMVVAKDSAIATLEDLRGKTVAAKIGTMGTEYVESIKEEYNLTVQYYEDSPAMYTAITSGINDACFEDRSVVEWAIKSEGLGLQTVGDVINPKEYGFAVQKGQNADLITMFNTGLANIQASGAYDEILAKYGY